MIIQGYIPIWGSLQVFASTLTLRLNHSINTEQIEGGGKKHTPVTVVKEKEKNHDYRKRKRVNDRRHKYESDY